MAMRHTTEHNRAHTLRRALCHAATGPSGDQYLVLCLLSQLALELLELLRGVAAERLVGVLQGSDLSRNLFLLLMGKPARERKNSQGS